MLPAKPHVLSVSRTPLTQEVQEGETLRDGLSCWVWVQQACVLSGGKQPILRPAARSHYLLKELLGKASMVKPSLSKALGIHKGDLGT